MLDWAAAELDRLEAQLNFSNATITELRGQLEKMAVERDSLRQQLAAAQERDIVLSRGILSVQNLINESRGVDGYHMNGNIAEWGMLLEDGCMLDEYSNALHLIHKITTDSLRKQSDFALITKMESDVADADEKITELEQQLAAAQERERWVPVTERLPKKDGNYMTGASHWTEAHELMFSAKSNRWWDFSNSEYAEPTHWRELPQLPEADHAESV